MFNQTQQSIQLMSIRQRTYIRLTSHAWALRVEKIGLTVTHIRYEKMLIETT